MAEEDTTQHNDFVAWLEAEIEKRGWTRAEFSRRSGMSQAMVSLVLNGQRGPGTEFCQGVADAFEQITPEDVMRRAGILPDLPLPIDDTIRQVVELMSYLPYHDRRDVLEFVRFRINTLKSQGGNE